MSLVIREDTVRRLITFQELADRGFPNPSPRRCCQSGPPTHRRLPRERPSLRGRGSRGGFRNRSEVALEQMDPRSEIRVGVNLGGMLPGRDDLDDRRRVVDGVGSPQRLHRFQYESTDLLGRQEANPGKRLRDNVDQQRPGRLVTTAPPRSRPYTTTSSRCSTTASPP